MTNVYLNFNQELQGCSKPNGTAGYLSKSDGIGRPNNLGVTYVSPRYHLGLAGVWKYVACMLLAFFLGIGEMWGASGIIPAAASTDLGSGNTPRYVVEAAGVGRLMKNATGSSSWSLSGSALTTGSSKFALQTYNEISSIIIYGNGTGNNRTFSSIRVGSTTSNYAAASATGSGTMANGGATDQTIAITPASNIAANSYVEITLSGNINIYSVELVYAAPSHPGYTFHYGTDGSSDWEIADFTQVGSSTEWIIEDFVIPSKTHLYVGDKGEFKSSGLGTGASSSNTVRWSDVPSEVCSPGCKWQGQPFLRPIIGSTISDYPVGQATGAVGKLTIYSDSGDKNLYLSFTPNGYIFRRNGTDAAMTNVSGNVYASPALEINADNCRQTIGVGLEKEDGHYSGAAHSLEVQHLFLRVNSNWSLDNAKFSIYNINESAFTSGFMTLVPGETDLYEGWVAASCTKVIFVRHNSTATYPSWDSGNKWNQTGDLTLQSGKNLFTLPNGAWDSSTTTWGNYTKKGKFYITATDITKNFGCHFVPGYTVTYNPGSGGVTGDAVEDLKIYGETLVLRGAGLFTRTGYSQTGWSTSDGGSKTHNLGANYTTNANLTLYPVWSPATFTISLNGNGGSGHTSGVTATYGSASISSITNPTRDCYTFDGWYSGEGGTGTLIINAAGALQASTSYTGAGGVWAYENDVTLYAKWTKNPTDLTVSRTGTEATPAGGEPHGVAYGTLTCTAQTGTIASYQWKQNTAGTKEGAVNAVGTGATTANFSPNPTDPGVYWYFCVATDACGNEVETSLSGCFTFVSMSIYTVTYDVNGGGTVSPTSETQSTTGAALTLPTPTWSGYTFEGWYNNGTKIGNGGASYIPTADITLYAHWIDNTEGKLFSYIDNNYGDKFMAFDLSGYVTANATGKDKTYTDGTTGVSYVINDGAWDNKSNAISALAKFKGGTTSMSIVIPTGKVATVKILYNAYGAGDDYRLTVNGVAQANPTTKLVDGWTNAQVISNMKEITLSDQSGTLTLGISNTGKNNYIGRVSVVITSHTVTYKPNGGTGDDVVDDNAVTVSDNTFTAPGGKTFVCWNTAADGSGTNYEVGATVTSDMTLYALWGYLLTYDANAGGDAVSNLPAAEPHMPSIITLSSKVPTRYGYIFDCWNRNAAGTGDCFSAGGSFTTGALNETLYAKWIVDDCTPPAAPVGLGVDSKTSTSATLSWDGGSAGVNGYMIALESATGAGTFDWKDEATASYTAAGLTPETEYTFKVKYKGGAGQCEFSAEVTYVFTTEAPCVAQSLSKVVVTGGSAGTVTGYNGKEYAGAAVVGGLSGTKTAEVDASHDGTETGYKLNSSGNSIVFATLAKGTFQVGDQVKVTIVYQNDNYTFPSPVSAKTGMDIYYGSSKDDATLLATLSGVTGAGTYSYTLTAADVTAIGSKKGIGIFRHSSRAQNQYVYSVEIVGCRDFSTWNVTYNANSATGGTAPTDATDYANGATVTAADNTGSLVKGDLSFVGWNTAADGSGISYAAGETFTITADVTLYAQFACPVITATAAAANGTASQTYYKDDVAGAITMTTNGTIYQWYRSAENDVESDTRDIIEGQTSATLTPSTSVFGTTYYFCVVSNVCGNSGTSNTVAITVEDPNPAPTADWTGTTTDPTHGGGGYTVTVVAKNYDGSALWDGTLTAAMLSASDGITLSNITVNNTTKTITATYGVTAAAESPIEFVLSLPATATHKAADLSYEVTFDACAGGSANTIIFESSTKDDAGNELGQINTGSSCMIAGGVAKLMTGSGNSKLNAASNKYGYRSSANYLIVVFKFDASTDLTIMHNANSTGDRYMQLYKFSSAKALSEITSSDWSSKTVQAFTSTSSAETWGGGGTSVVSTNGEKTTWSYTTKGCLSVTWEDLSAGYYVLLGVGDEAYMYGFSYESAISGGAIATTLAWSNGQADGATLAKSEYDADFTVTADRDNAAALASLGTISYSSSDVSVATVNATTGRVTIANDIDFGGADYKTTTITAAMTASGCYQGALLTYVLRVNKDVCEDAEGTITTTNLGCSGIRLSLSGYSAGATIAWYKDDVVIPGETGETYVTTVAGEYYAKTTLTGVGHCTMTSNTVVISDMVLSATAIVDSWYIKNDRRTPDIALVATEGATSFIVKSGSTVIWNSDGSVTTGFGGCEFYMGADGIIYLKGVKSDGNATTGLSAGDETLTFLVSGCGDAPAVNIVIHKQAATAKPSIAFIVDGDKGGAVDDVDASKTSGRPIWTYLSTDFNLTGCNGYWTNVEKDIREYYSQFDAILITDDPDTEEPKKGSGKKYVNALGTMVDIRPLLTLEAFVGKYGANSNWHVGATPSSPKPRQYEMKLQCKDHNIFTGLTSLPLPANVRMEEVDGIEYFYVTMVDRTHSTYDGVDDDTDTDNKPALQGFDASVFTGMLGIGTIANESLRGGVERQEEPAARMMILGIQHQAMAALTEQGKLVIKNALRYLLNTNMDDVDDCSTYFIGGTAGHETEWNTPSNWTTGHLPDRTVTARILAPCTVSGAAGSAAAVDIITGGRTGRYKSGGSDCEGSLTIQPTGKLIIDGRVRQIAQAPYFIEGNRVPTTPDILKIEATSANTGALIFDNADGTTQATVEMYSKSHWETVAGKKKKYWSYIGVPIKNVTIPDYFYLGFTYAYDETSGWTKRGDGTVLQPFEGIGLSMQTGHMETFTGSLASTQSQEITLTKTPAGGNGENLIGNSWTAPIQIAAFETSDFGGAEATVYVYNSGRDEEASGSQGTAAYGGNNASQAGQWITVPIDVAKVGGYTGLKVIPAMQAFQVNTSSETTLTLDYGKLVRPATTDVNAPLRAPRRNAPLQEEIDGILRVRVSGETTYTDVWLLSDASFSDEFDNGWEASYQDCDDRSAQLYALSGLGKMAFLAQPEIDGTVLGFAPSREGGEYIFSFHYLGDETLYLNDLKQETSTLISEENIYRFTYEEGDTHRFLISATPFGAPQIATGIGDTESGESTKVQKLIYRDKVYIIRGGRIYDVVGKIVR